MMRVPRAPPADAPGPHPPPAPRPPALAGNATWRLAAVAARALVGLVSVPIYTRLLGMPQWGLLALFQAATSPLVLLDMGIGSATVKYAAESLGRGDRQGAARVVQTTLAFNLAAGAVGAAALLVSAPWLATAVFSIPPADVARATLGFRLTGLSWGIGVVSATCLGVFAAHQRYGATARLATASMVLSAACGLGVAAATRDVVLVLLAQILVAAAMTAIAFRGAAALLPGIAGVPRWDRAAFRRSLSFGVWQTVAVGGTLLGGWADRYILGALFLPAVVGIYATAYLLYGQLYSAFLEMGEVLFPAVSHLEGQGDLPGARRLALLAGWTLTTGFGIGAAALAAVGGDFLHLWISPEAASAATLTLRLLCAGGIVGMAAIAPFYYLLGIGRTQWDAASATIVGLTIAGVDLVAVPRLGLPGAGIGLLAGVSLRWVIVALVWRSHFRPDFGLGAFAAHVFAPPLVSLGALAALCAAHDLLGRAPGWGWLAAEAAAAGLLAAAVQLAGGELLPGGAQRRRDVFHSFAPLLRRAMGLLSRS
jgi:O-antigen/teichoic acid export membrane protein